MMDISLPDIRTIAVKGKRVFLRSDLDAPVSEGGMSKQESRSVVDDTRLEASLATLRYLLEQGAKVIMVGHLRRPKGIDQALSLQPVASWFFKKLQTGNVLSYQKIGTFSMEETSINEFYGWKLSENLTLLENIRFFKEEYDNDPMFARKLASLADIYVNDAFASSHRMHASIVGVATYIPHYAGISLQKEVVVLSGILAKPKRPLVVVVGGAKIETKLPLVEKMYRLADYVLVGGKIADEQAVLLKVAHQKITNHKSALLVAELTSNKSDITPMSIENFLQIIRLAKTVVWNGPVGYIEEEQSQRGSQAVARGILASGAYSVVGGGDTLEFLRKEGLLDKFSFFSTGGGAMLAFLSGEKLPGIEVLFRP